MKKQMAALLTGSILALSISAGGVQAKTYGYDLGEGSTILFSVEDGTSEQENLTAEEQKKLADWHREDMRRQLAYLEKYGIAYDEENDRILYNGQPVRWLIDEQIDNTCMAVKGPEGEIDVYTVRADNYELTGVRVATEEEYNQRTQRDKAAEENVRYAYAIEGDSLADYAIEEDSLDDGTACVDSKETLAVTEKENSFEAEYDGWKEWEEKRREYEAAGISYDDKNNCWIWNGKQICWLVDENGGMTTNSSPEAKAGKVYLVVKRNDDGSIREVKQVTVEDAMREQMRER